ncbi:hypothetical protein FRB96_000577 [Tulasnella sp. 330]|nr:hypothetical protein FRB96_000577 [Tulasnella sp. 330]KAG8882075.1 hypothetical protein FRB97_008745 [Tulasnella sp. 331]KAG8888080.1 hypothetical protein FRB98_008417 [Tulasnella sp. 332]
MWAWDRFDIIALKVKRLENLEVYLDDDITAALLKRRTPAAPLAFVPILPRIQELAWNACDDELANMPALSFMSTTLRQLTITRVVTPRSILLKEIPARSPYITELEYLDYWSNGSYVGQMMEAVEGMLARLPHLRLVNLRLPGGSSDAMRPLTVLSRLTELRDLELEGEGNDNQDGVIHWPSSSSTPVFPSLRSLGLRWSKHGVPSLLRRVESSDLTSIELGYRNCGITDVSEAIRAAARQARLEHLSVTGQRSDVPIDRYFLAPAHCFLSLKTLDIGLEQPITMTDADLESSLPNLLQLRRFSLTTFSLQPPTLTLHAYIIIARSCPEIKFLKLAVNTSAPENLTQAIGDAHKCLAVIDVHDSDVGNDNPQALAAFFVRLTIVKHFSIRRETYGRSALKWENVMDVVSTLQHEREAEERAGGASE